MRFSQASCSRWYLRPVRRVLFLFLTLSTAASAARSRDLILLAVPNDDADRGVYRAAEGKLRDRADVENASHPYRELHDPAPLTLGQLDHPIPGWWPKDLRWDWESGAAACKTRAAAPYGPHNKEARICGAKLAEALWQRYVEHQKASRVVQVLMEPLNPTQQEVDDRQRLRVQAFVPGEPAQRTAQRSEVEYADVREVASVLALRVATGGGTAEPRAMLRALPTPKPKVDEPIPSFEGIKVPKRCGVTLPGALTVEPADARFSQILVAHWANTVRGLPETGPALACTLENESRPKLLMGQTVLLGSATLSCGKAKLVSKLHKTTQSMLDQVMSEEMTGKLVNGFCSGKLPLP